MMLANSDIQRWKLASEVSPYLSVPKNSLTIRIRNFPRLQSFDKHWPLYVGLGLTGLVYGGLHCLAWDAPFPSDIEKLLWRISSVTITSTGILIGMVLSWEVFGPIWRDFYHIAGTIYNSLENLRDWGPMKWLTDRALDRAYDNLPDPWRDIFVFFINAVFTYLPGFLLLLLKLAFDLSVIVVMVLYIVARVYLVVECFINLAHLPPSAYQLPQWSQYVPHIG